MFPVVVDLKVERVLTPRLRVYLKVERGKSEFEAKCSIFPVLTNGLS
jgi:hypothetical protein